MSTEAQTLNDIFDIPTTTAELLPVVQEVQENPPVIVIQETTVDQDPENDYQVARDTLNIMITKGKDALDGILDVAEAEGTPRAYEVAATLIKTLSDTTKQLIDMHKTMKDVRAKGTPEGTPGMNYIDKAVFMGNPNDLLTKVKENQRISNT